MKAEKKALHEVVEAIKEGDGYRQSITAGDYVQSLRLREGLRSRCTFHEALAELALFVDVAFELCQRGCQRRVVEDVEASVEYIQSEASSLCWGQADLDAIAALKSSVENRLPTKKTKQLSAKLKRVHILVQRRKVEQDLPYLDACVLSRVFAHLDPKTLARCASVCRLWNRLAASNDLWRDLVHRACPHTRDLTVRELKVPEHWREEYLALSTRHPQVFHLSFGLRRGCRRCLSTDWETHAGLATTACDAVMHNVPLSAPTGALLLFLRRIYEKENPMTMGTAHFQFFSQVESVILRLLQEGEEDGESSD
ncbi:F-box domain-containing protein [Chloropicon primus]|uniref:F-box domain-containing protein n=1 Tax=Chloropicon primus TaxID=1764295 RepID=A0A5B8MM73_9CHLO|nr:hypothetical protein A3770_06p41110 [Chloropicon primus]UPR00804.1 F-box domain-containing protein [Chloropicon primus]|eukprot:QDZ21593.1 hypothetical protein A3770_06p41110 [Chloropicon primus]